VWSPDGKWLAFRGARQAAASVNEFPDAGLFVLEMSGGAPALISDLEPVFTPIVSFSPDADRIFFTAEAGGCAEGCPPGYLYMIDANGHEPAKRLHDRPVDRALGVVQPVPVSRE
jgi:Tol biopolymer transport system component